jgi:hypothetical protein
MGQAVDNLEKPPTLLLPASFLSKYRPAPKIKPVVETPVEIAPVPIEPAPEKRPQIHKVDLTSPVKTKNAIIHAPPPMTPRTAPKDPKTRMEEYLKITPDVSAKVLPVLDTSIKWAMGSLVPVFNDEEKRWSQRNTVNTGSYFWQHTVSTPKSTCPSCFSLRVSGWMLDTYVSKSRRLMASPRVYSSSMKLKSENHRISVPEARPYHQSAYLHDSDFGLEFLTRRILSLFHAICVLG